MQYSVFISNVIAIMPTKSVNNRYQKHFDLISAYLRELRSSENKTQVEVGDESGLHRNTLLRVENSKNFTIVTLFQLADYYGMQPSEIISIID